MPGELLVYPLGRFFGFFLLSPLFASRSVPLILRGALTLCMTLLIAPLFLDKPPLMLAHSSLLALTGEVFIGFFLGLLFSLIIEGAMLAGEVLGTMSGFSALEILDPLSMEQTPLMAKTFGLVVLVIFIALDLHHMLLMILYQSFILLPIGSFSLPPQFLLQVFEGASLLFQLALQYAAAPATLLLLLLLFLSFLSRALPGLPLFWLSFPLQLLLGLVAIGLSFSAWPEMIVKSFSEVKQLAMRILLALSQAL